VQVELSVGAETYPFRGTILMMHGVQLDLSSFVTAPTAGLQYPGRSDQDSLIEEDGVLYWRDGIPGSDSPSRRRAGRRSEPSAPSGSLVLAKQFPVLAPNKVTAAIGAIDQRLNPSIEATLCSRLRQLQGNNGRFALTHTDVIGPFTGRTLLFVHGTFSNAGNMLGEFEATPPGQRFLNEVMSGAKKYDNVVFLEHATLAISPVINALELGRAFAGSSGQIDVIAHSRGGLIVRWWLEAFGSSLHLTDDKPVRVIFAGSPLAGTSLAAPDRLQHSMSLISNIGTFAEKTMTLVGVANPFLWVAGKLVEVIVSVTGALANTPLVDALVAVIPGLSGQSAVDNNYELNRLRLGPCAVSPFYYAIKSNFETLDPGWKFWQNFREDRMSDIAADTVFPGANDLVDDTWSMTPLGGPEFKLKFTGDACDFGTSPTVWHCNYFRQPETINYIAAKLN
jgi:hypothetical protein